jgi:hypothetical protein
MCIICRAAIFEIASKATTTPVAPTVSRVFAFLMQAEQSITVDQKSPGGSDSPQGLILFDGVCVLCSRGCHFVSKRDRRGREIVERVTVAADRIDPAHLCLVADPRAKDRGTKDQRRVPRIPPSAGPRGQEHRVAADL